MLKGTNRGRFQTHILFAGMMVFSAVVFTGFAYADNWTIDPAHSAALDGDGRRYTYMNETRNETKPFVRCL